MLRSGKIFRRAATGRKQILPIQLKGIKLGALAVGLSLALAACATAPPPTPRPAPSPSRVPPTQRPYEVYGKLYTPLPSAEAFREEGLASWYGAEFHGLRTANGEVYDMNGMTAAHKILPMNVSVRVINLENNKSAILRINDRGPFVEGRIIDLSAGAAKALGIHRPGTARVRIEALGYAVADGRGSVTYAAPSSLNWGNLTIQVGAFSSLENAMRLKEQLSASFENAHITIYNSGRETLYRVRVGTFKTIEEGSKAQRQIALKGFPRTFLVAE